MTRAPDWQTRLCVWVVSHVSRRDFLRIARYVDDSPPPSDPQRAANRAYLIERAYLMERAR